jgi:motility quorum-sensing regulator/GCU-specific mRNA interferase toxin
MGNLTGTFKVPYCLGGEAQAPLRPRDHQDDLLRGPGSAHHHDGLRCARALNLTLEDVVACIQALTREHFYKSMTALANTAIWQDVYHAPYRGLVLYVKFTTDAEGYLVISFKER